MDINKEEATLLNKVYEVGEPEGIHSLLNDLESGMYGCKNSDGEDVVVLREVGSGLEILTFQDNGWLRVNYFDENGYDDGEAFRGRWDK